MQHCLNADARLSRHNLLIGIHKDPNKDWIIFAIFVQKYLVVFTWIP